MTTIRAEVVADSVSPEDIRLTTMQLRYPRFIHAEFMTHRVFSRNASSSRAVPVERIIAQVEEDPVMPLHWGRNKPGMQSEVLLNSDETAEAKKDWHKALKAAVYQARELAHIGAHKQIVNRLLEPFAHIDVVVTATEWSNFFALRCHEDAEPHMRMLADAMWEAMHHSMATPLGPEQWHLPYVSPEEQRGMAGGTAIMCSVARCARVSYQNHDGGKPSPGQDYQLYRRLVGSHPMHASPAEHQAHPDKLVDVHLGGGEYAPVRVWESPELHGNLTGWVQYRKTLKGESR